MKKFTMYFEVCGKKLKTEIEANNYSEAQRKIIERIIWYDDVKQAQEQPYTKERDDELDFLKGIFGMK
jgi:hypothetical protein